MAIPRSVITLYIRFNGLVLKKAVKKPRIRPASVPKIIAEIPIITVTGKRFFISFVTGVLGERA